MMGGRGRQKHENKVPNGTFLVKKDTKVGCTDIQLDHVLITKTHILPAAMMRRMFLQILFARTFRYLFETWEYI